LSASERAVGPSARVEWAVARRALPGEIESGDLHVVESFPGGSLLAAVDGLGHGSEAAVAARAAVEVLRHNAQESVLSLVRRCHRALQETRGAAMSLASFNSADSSLAWLAIGNVEGTLVRADPGTVPNRESLLLRGGVVGYRLPALHASLLSVGPGDLLVLATDGVDSGFTATEMNATEPLQALADRVLAQWGKETDDALVLVGRFPGEEV
jgi:negative regulator of sigma-B (phosphoserine phosphatase)